MTYEDNMAAQHTRGIEAGHALDSFNAAFAAVRENYVDAWMKSNPRDTEGREKLWVATTIVSAVQNQLMQWVRDGKVSEKQLEQIRKAGEPKTLIDKFRSI